MPVNSSANEKTILSTYKALPNDLWTLDKTNFYGNYKDSVIVAVSSILDDYRDYFEQSLEDADVPEKFYYQPTAFSQYYYGTPDLDWMVLYFAKMSSLFEFNKNKIKILPKSRLVEINKLMIYYQKDVTESKLNPEKYTEIKNIKTQKKFYI